MSVIHITFYKQKQKTETKSINQSKPNIFFGAAKCPHKLKGRAHHQEIFLFVCSEKGTFRHTHSIDKQKRNQYIFCGNRNNINELESIPEELQGGLKKRSDS
ncbi:hypothetical protein Hanom_Chr03g00268191 [Helianthus anomalus]